MMNHKSSPKGIPCESIRSETALAAEAASGGAVQLGELAAAWDRVQAATQDKKANDLLQGKILEYEATVRLADAEMMGAAATRLAVIENQKAALMAQDCAELPAALLTEPGLLTMVEGVFANECL